LDENIAEFWVWLNSSKSDDLRTNALSTSTFLDFLVTIIATLQKVRMNVYFILISESGPYVLGYRSIWDCQMKISIKSQKMLTRGQKKVKLYLRYCHSFVTQTSKLKISKNIFFEIMIMSCLALYWSTDLPCRFMVREIVHFG